MRIKIMYYGQLTVRRLSVYSLAEACKLARQGCCLEGVPDLRRGLLCTNGGGLTGAIYGLEVYSVFAAKHLWVEYGQASEFINLHLFPWRYW